jgi:hypothetical protein
MKRIINVNLLIAIITCGSFINGNAQIVVKVKPNKPKVLVVKPATHKHGHVWRGGHWNWNKKNNKYKWVKACWVKENHGHNWSAGHWVKNRNGHSWVAGTWKKGEAHNKAHKKVHKKHNH